MGQRFQSINKAVTAMALHLNPAPSLTPKAVPSIQLPSHFMHLTGMLAAFYPEAGPAQVCEGQLDLGSAESGLGLH